MGKFAELQKKLAAAAAGKPIEVPEGFVAQFIPERPFYLKDELCQIAAPRGASLETEAAIFDRNTGKEVKRIRGKYVFIPQNWSYDLDLCDWLKEIEKRTMPGDFLYSVAHAAQHADEANYVLMRPVLLVLKEKYKAFPPNQPS